MSTNGMTTWAVDLKDIGAIYPFQGAEAIMVIILLVVWIGWHWLQIRQEEQEMVELAAADPRGEKTRSAIDRY